MADLLFSVGADLSGLTADLGRLQQLVAQIRLPTGLDQQIRTIAQGLRVINTEAAKVGDATGRAAAGMRKTGESAGSASSNIKELTRQLAFALRASSLVENARIGDLGAPKAVETLRQFIQATKEAKASVDAGGTATAQSTNAYEKARLAYTEASLALKKLTAEGTANIRAGREVAASMEKSAVQAVTLGGNLSKVEVAAQKTGQTIVQAEKDMAASFEKSAVAANTLGGNLSKVEVAAQKTGQTIVRARKEMEGLADRQLAALERQAKNLSPANLRFVPEGLDVHLRSLAAAQQQLVNTGKPLGDTFKTLTAESARFKEASIAGARSAIAQGRAFEEMKKATDPFHGVFDNMSTSILRAVKVGATFTAVYGGLRAAIGGVQELVQLDKQMTNIASTITDAGQRAKTLPVAFDLTREAMTTLGLSAEKAGGLVFELQKVFDGNAELMRAAFVPALVLTANKEADQAETIRVLVGAYNLYGNTLEGAGTAQEKFTKLSDQLLKSSFLSVASVGDLATALGSVAATGRASGISFSQLLGTLVVLQDSLRKAGQSGAGLNRTFEALLENVLTAANVFGVQFDIDKGIKPFELLLEILEKINKELEAAGGTPTESLADKINRSFPTIQSRQTILTLASQVGRIREVATEAAGATDVTTTSFQELQKAIGAAASSLGNQLLVSFADFLSALGGDTPGKFEGIAKAIQTISDVAKTAGESLVDLAKTFNLIVTTGRAILDVASAAGEAASGAVTGNTARTESAGKTVSTSGSRLRRSLQSLGLDPFDPDLTKRTDIGREFERALAERRQAEVAAMFDAATEKLGPTNSTDVARSLRALSLRDETAREKLTRVGREASSEIFEESERQDTTKSLPERLAVARAQLEKSEAAFRQGEFLFKEGRLGKEAEGLVKLKQLARDYAEDRKRVLSVEKEIADFDARNFVETKKRQEELFQSQLKLNDELRLRAIETLPGGADDKFVARLDFETQQEIDEVEKRVKNQQEYANAVVSIMAIRDEKLRQFRIQNENAEIESFTRQFEAYRQTTESEEQLEADKLRQTLNQNLFIGGLNGENPADTVRKTFEKGLGADKLDAELRQMVATLGLFGEEATDAGLRAKFMSAAFKGVLTDSQLKQLEEVIKRVATATESIRLQKFRDENAQTENQIKAAAASFGLYGEEAERASLAITRHGESYGQLNAEQRTLVDQTAKLTVEFRQQQAVLSLLSVGFDEVTAKMIVQRNEASQKRLGELETSAKELRDFNEAAERTRDILLEIGRQNDRREGDVAGFFIKSMQKAANEAGGFFKNLEDLGTDTARNLQSAFSDLFFDVFTNKAQSAAEVFKNFTNSMLRSISNFLANQLVQQLLSIFFPGAGGPQQLAGPTGLAGGLSGIVTSIKELFSGTGAAGTTVAQGPTQLSGPGFEGSAAVSELPTSTGGGFSSLLAALPAIGASASALGAMLGPEGSGLARFGSLAAALGGASTLFKSFQNGNLFSTGGLAGIASIAGAGISLSGVGGQTGALAGNALSSLGLLAGGPGSGLAGGALAASTLINAYRSFTNPEANQGTGVGGVAGTVVGGAIGAYLTDGSASGTAVGAGIGGAIGEFIGSFFGKEGVSHKEREDKETARAINIAIQFQQAIQGATSALDLFNVLVQGIVDSDAGKGNDFPIVTYVGGTDIRSLSPDQLLKADPASITADIVAGVRPENLAEAEQQLAETIRAMITALKAVQSGLARFGEVAINLTKDSGTLLNLEAPKGAFEEYRENLKDVDEELANAVQGISGIPKNLDDIIALVNKRYQLELDFLKEVSDAAKAIHESVKDQRTDIELQFATPAEKVKIIQRQLDEVINSVRLATDPKEIASLVQEGQGLVRDLLGQSASLTDDFGLSQPAIKQTALNLLNQLEELSTGRLGSLSEAARAGDTEFVDMLLDASQKMGLTLDLTNEQLQGLATNAARASEALIQLGVAPSSGNESYAPGFAQGGFVPGSGTGDIVRAMLEPGEFVMPKGPASMHGDLLEMLRSMGVQQFAEGGYVPFWQRVFGNTNPQPFGNYWENLSTAQKLAVITQTGLNIGSVVPGSGIPLYGSMGTAWLGRKLDLLPTYNTGSFLGDAFLGSSDRGIFTRTVDLFRDIGTSLFGTSDRLAPSTAGGGLSDYLRSAAGGGVGSSGGLSDLIPFLSGPPSLGGVGDFPFGFDSPMSTTRSAPSYAPALSQYFSSAFDGFSVSGSGSAYPSGSSAAPFGGSRYTGGITDPYAFNIPYDYSPLTYGALGFSPSSYYEGAIADRALSSGGLFSGGFSASYTATNPYQDLLNYYSSPWMGPGVTGQGFNPYRFAPGNYTMYGGQIYQPTYSGSGYVSSTRRFAEGGYVSGSGNTDSVPALLTPGEYVVPAGVAAANKSLLESLSKTGIGTPTTTTAAGARQTMTRAAGTALGSLSKGIGTTIIKAGERASTGLNEAIDPLTDAFIQATAVAMHSIVGGLAQFGSTGAIGNLWTPPGTGTADQAVPLGTNYPSGGGTGLLPSWMIPGLTTPTQESIDKLIQIITQFFSGGSTPTTTTLAILNVDPAGTLSSFGNLKQGSLSAMPESLRGVITPEQWQAIAGQFAGAGGFAEGGFVAGSPSGSGFDNVPIWASAGEFVVPRYAAMANAAALEHLRDNGTLPGGQNVMFNLHFDITGATDAQAVAEEVEKKIESSVRTGRLGVVIAERQKRRV